MGQALPAFFLSRQRWSTLYTARLSLSLLVFPLHKGPSCRIIYLLVWLSASCFSPPNSLLSSSGTLNPSLSSISLCLTAPLAPLSHSSLSLAPLAPLSCSHRVSLIQSCRSLHPCTIRICMLKSYYLPIISDNSVHVLFLKKDRRITTVILCPTYMTVEVRLPAVIQSVFNLNARVTSNRRPQPLTCHCCSSLLHAANSVSGTAR